MSRAQPQLGVPFVHLIVGLVLTTLVALLQPTDSTPLLVKHIADKLAAGEIAYRDFSIEYPPLALLHIYLPRLLGGPGDGAYELYFTLLGLSLSIATAAVVFVLARRGWSAERPIHSVLVFGGLALALAPVVLWRHDILPAFLSALALLAYALRSSVGAGLALGLGTAAKLYPVLLGGVLGLVSLFERRYRSAVAMAALGAITVGAIALEVYLVAGSNAFSYLFYQEDRGIEIESVAGGLALLADTLGLGAARITYGFGSIQVETPVLPQIGLVLTVLDLVLLAALVAGVLWTFRRDMRVSGAIAPGSIVAYLVATLLLLILVNKVLSPQYLVWLLPFAALLPRPKTLVVLAIAALTTTIYPFLWKDLVALQPGVVVALNVRNLLLLALFVWVAVPGAFLGSRASPRW